MNDNDKYLRARENVKLLITKPGDALNFPKFGDSIMMHYICYLDNGEMIDNSYNRGQPCYFILGANQVIMGWECVIPILSKGAKAKIEIPSDLAYGDNGYAPLVPPNATLTYEIELISFSSDGTAYRAKRDNPTNQDSN